MGISRQALDKWKRQPEFQERVPALVEAKAPTCTEEEVEGYVWDVSNGRRRGEEPVKVDDHGMDCVRYVVAHRDVVMGRRARVRVRQGDEVALRGKLQEFSAKKLWPLEYYQVEAVVRHRVRNWAVGVAEEKEEQVRHPWTVAVEVAADGAQYKLEIASELCVGAGDRLGHVGESLSGRGRGHELEPVFSLAEPLTA